MINSYLLTARNSPSKNFNYFPNRVVKKVIKYRTIIIDKVAINMNLTPCAIHFDKVEVLDHTKIRHFHQRNFKINFIKKNYTFDIQDR